MNESAEQRIRQVLLEEIEQRWGLLSGLSPEDVRRLLESVPLEVLLRLLHTLPPEEDAVTPGGEDLEEPD